MKSCFIRLRKFGQLDDEDDPYNAGFDKTDEDEYEWVGACLDGL